MPRGKGWEYRSKVKNDWIREARSILKKFRGCWQGAPNRGWSIPKSSLEDLHDCRERADLLLRTSPVTYKWNKEDR